MIRYGSDKIGQWINPFVKTRNNHAVILPIPKLLPRQKFGLDAGAKAIINGLFHIKSVRLYRIIIGQRTFIDTVHKPNGEILSFPHPVFGNELSRSCIPER